jgi:hypothetical protein
MLTSWISPGPLNVTKSLTDTRRLALLPPASESSISSSSCLRSKVAGTCRGREAGGDVAPTEV